VRPLLWELNIINSETLNNGVDASAAALALDLLVAKALSVLRSLIKLALLLNNRKQDRCEAYAAYE